MIGVQLSIESVAFPEFFSGARTQGRFLQGKHTDASSRGCTCQLPVFDVVVTVVFLVGGFAPLINADRDGAVAITELTEDTWAMQLSVNIRTIADVLVPVARPGPPPDPIPVPLTVHIGALEHVAVVHPIDPIPVRFAVSEHPIRKTDTVVMGPCDHPISLGVSAGAPASPSDRLARSEVRVPQVAAAHVGRFHPTGAALRFAGARFSCGDR